MADDTDFFAPPPFKPDEALLRLKRELRDLGLSEREGLFQRNGLPIARAQVDGAALTAERVRRPQRAGTEWQTRRLTDAAALRDFVADLKKALQQLGDRDD